MISVMNVLIDFTMRVLYVGAYTWFIVERILRSSTENGFG